MAPICSLWVLCRPNDGISFLMFVGVVSKPQIPGLFLEHLKVVGSGDFFQIRILLVAIDSNFQGPHLSVADPVRAFPPP